MSEHVNTDACCACCMVGVANDAKSDADFNYSLRFIAVLIFVFACLYNGLNYRMRLHELSLRWNYTAYNNHLIFDGNGWVKGR